VGNRGRGDSWISGTNKAEVEQFYGLFCFLVRGTGQQQGARWRAEAFGVYAHAGWAREGVGEETKIAGGMVRGEGGQNPGRAAARAGKQGGSRPR